VSVAPGYATPGPTLDLDAKLRAWFGHDQFRAGQRAVVEAILNGQDVLAIMPTGAGKSLCYQLAAMLLDGCTLVVSPLLALMKDQIDGLPPAVYERATVISSMVDGDELQVRQAAIADGRTKLVYAAPERLRQRAFIDAIRRAGVAMVVIDEAHCVSLWGHDFRPDYLFVPRALAELGRDAARGAPRLLAMTATATPAIQRELGARLGRPLTTVATGVLRDNLRLEVEEHPQREAKLRALVRLCKQDRGSGIVYATSRDQTEQVAQLLRRSGVSAGHYHAGMPRQEREAAQNAYMLDHTRVMVATTAFGMGVDKSNVRFVAHLSPSRSLEAYVQESGRAGRDGRPARCVLLTTRSDRATLRRWASEVRLDIHILRRLFGELRRLATTVEGDDEGTARRGATHAAASDLTSAEKAAVPRAYAAVELDALAQAANSGPRALDGTDLRVALSLLEEAGLIRRHVDIPRYLRLECVGRATDGGVASPPVNPAFARLFPDAQRPAGTERADASPLPGASSHGAIENPTSTQAPTAPLSPYGDDDWPADPDADDPWMTHGERSGNGNAHQDGSSAVVGGPLIDLARRAGVPPSELEALALDWQVLGLVRVTPRGRCALVELPPAPPEVGRLVPAALDRRRDAEARRLDALFAYLDATRCRHLMIAEHFQVQADRTCEMCDVCRPRGGSVPAPAQAPEREPIVDRHPADVILDAAKALPFSVGKKKLAYVVHGSVQSPIGPDRFELVGALSHLKQGEIERHIDALLQGGYLERTEDEFPVLLVTREGRDKAPDPPRSLAERPRAPLRTASAHTPTQTDSPRGPRPRPSAGDDWFAPDSELPSMPAPDDIDEAAIGVRFERLRAWRRLQAEEERVAPFMVFSNATLEQIARRNPTSRAAFGNISGIGPAKLDRYAEAVLALLADEPPAGV